MRDLIETAFDLQERGANVVIKDGVIILMNDSEFAAYMSSLMAD